MSALPKIRSGRVARPPRLTTAIATLEDGHLFPGEAVPETRDRCLRWGHPRRISARRQNDRPFEIDNGASAVYSRRRRVVNKQSVERRCWQRRRRVSNDDAGIPANKAILDGQGRGVRNGRSDIEASRDRIRLRLRALDYRLHNARFVEHRVDARRDRVGNAQTGIRGGETDRRRGNRLNGGVEHIAARSLLVILAVQLRDDLVPLLPESCRDNAGTDVLRADDSLIEHCETP